MRDQLITLVMNLKACKYSTAEQILAANGFREGQIPWRIKLDKYDSILVAYSQRLGRFVLHCSPGVDINRWTASRQVRLELENLMTEQNARDQFAPAMGGGHEE